MTAEGAGQERSEAVADVVPAPEAEAQQSEVPESKEIEAVSVPAVERSIKPNPCTPRVVEKERFIAWLAVPLSGRVPQTQKELAAELGVHEGTLSHWKHDGSLIEEVKRRIRGMLLNRVAGAMHAVADRAEKEGDVAAAKLVWDKAFEEKDGIAVGVQVNVSADKLAEETEVLVVSDVVKR